MAKRDETGSKKKQAYDQIKKMIIENEVEKDAPLVERVLCERLGISRTPVREALRMLEQENLVELIPRRGAQVLDISAEDIKNILEIRSALEVVSIRHACQKMDNDSLKELKKYNAEFEAAFEARDYEGVATADEKFHDVIFSAAGNKRLVVIISNIQAQVYRYRMAYLKVYETKTAVLNHHRNIIEAIEKHDAALGEKVMAEHIEHQTQVILKSLKN